MKSPKETIVRLVNRAHLHPSAWVRRPAVIAGMLGLVLYTVVFYSVLPFMIGALLALNAITFVGKFLMSIPAGMAEIIEDERSEWRRNISGAIRIWREQKKLDPQVERGL